MSKHKKPPLPDANVTAFLFVQKLTGQPPVADKPKSKAKKRPTTQKKREA